MAWARSLPGAEPTVKSSPTLSGGRRAHWEQYVLTALLHYPSVCGERTMIFLSLCFPGTFFHPRPSAHNKQHLSSPSKAVTFPASRLLFVSLHLLLRCCRWILHSCFWPSCDFYFQAWVLISTRRRTEQYDDKVPWLMKNKRNKTEVLTATENTAALSHQHIYFSDSLCRSLKNVATLALDSLISLIKAEVHRWQVAPGVPQFFIENHHGRQTIRLSSCAPQAEVWKKKKKRVQRFSGGASTLESPTEGHCDELSQQSPSTRGLNTVIKSTLSTLSTLNIHV